MTTASLTRSRLGARGSRWADEFWQFAQRHREAWPAVAIVVATVAAYHFTLSSMFDFLRLDTPLAYLPLLPLFCVGIAVVTAKRYSNAKRPIQDRQIDFLVGIPMVLVALLLITLAPVIASAYYWTDRADVLSLALFAAGATIIGYGITWFWRLKASFIFLVLMWPALYLHLMAGVMQQFADWTNAALAQIVHILPIGVSLGGQSGLLIVNQAHAAPLQISVGTACSGANSVLGFALIGGAILTTMGGGKGRKLLWWVSGLVLCFVLNIVRLVSILALASWGHPGLALGGYHAVIGLILFAIAVTVMLFALPWFGLRPKAAVAADGARATHKTDTVSPSKTTSLLEEHLAARAADESTEPVAPQPAPAPASATPLRQRLRTVGDQVRPWTLKRKIATGAVLFLTAVVALADHGLQPYAAFDDGSGSPTVKAFGTASAPSGWEVYQIAEYPWATQYFGENSTWFRYTVTRPGTGAVAYADVVLTDDKSTLDTYNLLNCFLFHNYDIRTSQRIDLGSGVYGLLLNYTDPATNTKWGTVSWAWPVQYKGDTYYERVALTSSPLQGAPANAPSFQPAGGLQDIFLDLLNGVSGGHNDASAAPLFKNVDTALEGTATVLVGHTVKSANG